MRKLTTDYKRLLNDRGAEAAREMALLWLVFSALDSLLGGHLTLSWLLMNFGGCLAVWFFGIYMEIVAKEML
jgi:hypothetical protein